MNYNYTNGMRRVLAMAREEAIRLQHDYVGPEHLVLGLSRHDNGPAAIILKSLGIELDLVYYMVDDWLHRGKATIALGLPEYTTAAKKVLEFSMIEAREMGDAYVGTEHLLLGLLHDEQETPAEALGCVGVTLGKARRKMQELKHANALSDSPPEPRNISVLSSKGIIAVAKAIPHTRQSGIGRRTAENTTLSEAAIFISYRRGDEAGYVAGHIYDRLTAEFGKSAVFKDVDSIPAGVDFKRHLQDAVENCSVFLAVVSPNWHERLKIAEDFVRIEVETALGREVPIIPLFVHGASMPREEHLPTTMRTIVYRNGLQIRRDPDFSNDIRRLIKEIQRIAPAR